MNKFINAIKEENLSEVINSWDDSFDINTVFNYGLTALHYAAIQSNSKILSFVLRKNPDPNIKDNFDMTALHYAAQYRRLKNVRLLLTTNIDVNAQDADGDTAIHLAASRGEIAIIKRLLARGGRKSLVMKNKMGWTPLYSAIHYYQYETAEFLVKEGADPFEEFTKGVKVIDAVLSEAMKERIENAWRNRALTSA